MECPTCKQSMEKIGEDISVGKLEKKYHRVIYCCKVDDVWITIETPVEN